MLPVIRRRHRTVRSNKWLKKRRDITADTSSEAPSLSLGGPSSWRGMLEVLLDDPQRVDAILDISILLKMLAAPDDTLDVGHLRAA